MLNAPDTDPIRRLYLHNEQANSRSRPFEGPELESSVKGTKHCPKSVIPGVTSPGMYDCERGLGKNFIPCREGVCATNNNCTCLRTHKTM